MKLLEWLWHQLDCNALLIHCRLFFLLTFLVEIYLLGFSQHPSSVLLVQALGSLCGKLAMFLCKDSGDPWKLSLLMPAPVKEIAWLLSTKSSSALSGGWGPGDSDNRQICDIKSSWGKHPISLSVLLCQPDLWIILDSILLSSAFPSLL